MRYAIATPKFQAEFEQLQAEYFKALDKRMSRLLFEAVKCSAKMLRHKDWRARDAACEKVLRIHGKYVEKLDLTGQLNHIGQVSYIHQVGVIPPQLMNDETRKLARRLLEITKQPKKLPAAFRVNGHAQEEEDS